MPNELRDLMRTRLNENIGGIGQVLYFAPLNWFAAIQPVTSPWVVSGDSVTIDGDHTFQTGKGWIKIEGDYKKNNADSKKAADWGSNNGEHNIKGTIHGLSAEIEEILFELNNTDGILLVKNLKSGGLDEVLQYGTEAAPCRMIEAAGGTGTPDAGMKGKECTFQCYQPTLLFYPGVITEKP